ncbi:MAG: tetratricopeptide repeat protein [Bryobacteraceae bacterium]|jgi:tetratricopeptide (TPR) repeat protein
MALLSAAFSVGFGLAASDQSAAERATELAEQGKCTEAMPLIHQALEQDSQIQDRDLKRRMGAAGVRCAMMLNHQGAATTLLAWLEEEFPHDPEILFMATHVYSDLSARSSQELMEAAPDSPLVVEINAEKFEKQGDWRKAIAEYRVLLEREPRMPGIHNRIGQIILTLPATATSNDEARKEFEQELKVYPQNAGAEYFLGELARKGGHLPQAIEHYTNATRLNAGLPEPYFGLGRCLLDSDRAADAVGPLETAAKLAPGNPTIHFTLAHAYQDLGRKEDAAREFALQKSTAEKIQHNTETVKRNVSGVPAPDSGGK